MKMKYLDRPFEVKDIDDSGKFKGYASVFGEIDSYRDIVMPGAFKKSLASYKEKNRLVPMLWQHRSAEPMGVYTSLKEDSHGLLVEGDINMDTQRGREGHSLMKQGALTGLSIGYNTVMFKDDEKKLIRELHELDLWEVSPVTFPAGDSARIQTVKSWDDLTTLADCEEALQNMFGLSKSESERMIHRIKAASGARGEPVKQSKGSGSDLLKTLQNFQL